MRKKKHMAMKLLSMSPCNSDGASPAITKVVMVDKGKRVDGVNGWCLKNCGDNSMMVFDVGND
jgi:hypothetical protein